MSGFFAFTCAVAANFDVVLVGITARGDHQAVLDEGIRVADQHRGQHADIGFAHLFERGEFDALFGAEGGFDDCHRRLRVAVA